MHARKIECKMFGDSFWCTCCILIMHFILDDVVLLQKTYINV